MKKVLITGIGSGIGYATAEFFLKQGFFVIGSVRSIQSIETLIEKYPDQLLVWLVDFSKIKNIDSILKFLSENKIHGIDILINNAGVAKSGPFQFQNFDEIEETVNINVLAVMRLTQLMIPFLIATQGRVVNISSLSGLSGMPFLSGYCASKFAIEGFSEALRRELKIYSIEVVVVGPGSIQTPIWSKGFKSHDNYDKSAYKNSYRRFLKMAENEADHALPVQVVVDDIYKASTSDKPNVRYNPVPRKFKNWYLARLIPKFFYEKILCRSLGLINK